VSGRPDPDEGVGKRAFDLAVEGKNLAWLSVDPAGTCGWHLQVGDNHWSGHCSPGKLIEQIPWDEAEGCHFLVTIERAFYGDTTEWGSERCRTCNQPKKTSFKGSGKKGSVTMIETQGFVVCEIARHLRGRIVLGFWRPIAASWRSKIDIKNRRETAKPEACRRFHEKFGRHAACDDEAEAYCMTTAAQSAPYRLFPRKRQQWWMEVKG
jgi:hypothetical protein